MDWSRLALSDYATAALGVPAAGRGVGQFLNFLHSVTGAPFNTMHLVGFSLGAHMVGNAGRELGGRVARVSGKYSRFKFFIKNIIISTHFILATLLQLLTVILLCGLTLFFVYFCVDIFNR